MNQWPMRRIESTQLLEVIPLRKVKVMDEQYDYVPPVHEVCAVDEEFISRRRNYSKKGKDSKPVST
jgi:hypothetical protein